MSSKLYASTRPFEGALCTFEAVFAPSWDVFAPSWASWRRLEAIKNIAFVTYTNQKSVFQPICVNDTFWRHLLYVWNVFAPSWSVCETSWAVSKPSWSKQKHWFCYIHLSKICLLVIRFNNTCWGALCAFETVFAPSWSVFESSCGVLEQATTLVLLNKSIKKLSFNLYASTTPLEGALCAFETVFAPSWNVFESSLAV